MQRHGNTLLYAPSDLGNFTACEHLTQLELSVALGERTRQGCSNAYIDLIASKGRDHEKSFLDSLRGDGHEVVEPSSGYSHDFGAAAEATAAAIRQGAKYIYQAVFVSGDWHGIADFLERVEKPSVLGN